MGYPLAFANLEAAVLDAGAAEDEWPAQIAAGVNAAVDYAVAHPEVAEQLASDARAGADTLRCYQTVIAQFAAFIRVLTPVESRLPGSTDEVLVAGVVALVGDHLRIGRLDRLEELRPELVLLTLLPYLGFSEAQRWANWELD